MRNERIFGADQSDRRKRWHPFKTHTLTHTPTHTHTDTHTHPHTHPPTHTHSLTHTPTDTPILTFTHTHRYAHTQTLTHPLLHSNTLTHTNTFLQTYTHTTIHNSIDEQICFFLSYSNRTNRLIGKSGSAPINICFTLWYTFISGKHVTKNVKY